MKRNRINFTLAFLLGAAAVGLPNTLCAAEFDAGQQQALIPLGIYSSTIGIDTNKANDYLDLAVRVAMDGQHERAQQLKADVANELRRFVARPTMYSGPAGVDTKMASSLLDLAVRMQMSPDTRDVSVALKGIIADELRRFVARPTGLQTAGGVNTKMASSLLDLADRLQLSPDTRDISVALKGVVADELRRFVARPTMYSGPAGVNTKMASSLLDLADRLQLSPDTRDISVALKGVVADELRRFVLHPTMYSGPAGVDTKMASSLLDLADRMQMSADTRDISVALKGVVVVDLRRFAQRPTGLQTAGGVNSEMASALLDLAGRMQMSADTRDLAADLKAIVADVLSRAR